MPQDRRASSAEKVERRTNRLTVPPRLNCASPNTKIVSRVEYALYVCCSACGLVWSVKRPGETLPSEQRPHARVYR